MCCSPTLTGAKSLTFPKLSEDSLDLRPTCTGKQKRALKVHGLMAKSIHIIFSQPTAKVGKEKAAGRLLFLSKLMGLSWPWLPMAKPMMDSRRARTAGAGSSQL